MRVFLFLGLLGVACGGNTPAPCVLPSLTDSPRSPQFEGNATSSWRERQRFAQENIVSEPAIGLGPESYSARLWSKLTDR